MTQHFYSKLKHDKLHINGNKNLIRMDLFLSFIKKEVELTRSNNHLGFHNGWTRLENEELNLVIGGGIVGNIEYLDSLEFGTHLDNKYNNFVNPFYILDILTDQGKSFFLNYYKDDIDKMISEKKTEIDSLKKSLTIKKDLLDSILSEIDVLSQSLKI